MTEQIILASASPQRKQLLESLGVDFAVQVSGVDEAACPEQDPAERSLVLAQLKAETVAAEQPEAYVIGCDTLVVSVRGETLEKAPDAAAARAMVQKLSGATCTVHSGLCVVPPTDSGFQIQKGISSSQVTFKELTDDDLDWWISTGLWQDRSGSFQIDGPGQMMIAHIEGDFTSIVGLPIFLLSELFGAYQIRLGS